MVWSAKDLPNEICVKNDLSMVRSNAELNGKSKIEAKVAKMKIIVDSAHNQANNEIRFRRYKNSSFMAPSLFLTKKSNNSKCPIVNVADAR